MNKIISNKNNLIREFENGLNLRFNIDHAFKTSQNNNPLPYTKTGMTGSKTNIIPEYVGFDENNKVLVNKWKKK